MVVEELANRECMLKNYFFFENSSQNAKIRLYYFQDRLAIIFCFNGTSLQQFFLKQERNTRNYDQSLRQIDRGKAKRKSSFVI